MIHQPDNNIGRSIVPQDQAAAFSQNTVGAVEEILRIRIMMETVGTDDRVERTFRKRQVFAVSGEKFGVGELFCLRNMDHLRCEVKPDIVFARVFLLPG